MPNELSKVEGILWRKGIQPVTATEMNRAIRKRCVDLFKASCEDHGGRAKRQSR